MIRPSMAEEAGALVALGVEAGLFSAEEAPWLAGMLDDYFGGRLGEGHAWMTHEHDGEVLGAAYYAPTPASDRVWDLLMIAVRPGGQRRGVGAELLAHVERALRESGQRMLLVDTSSTPRYEKARAFYRKHGFDEEARIRDFYKDGDDKVVFRKMLATTSA